MENQNLFRYFKTSPEVIRLAVIMYIRFPLNLHNVEDLLYERGIDICHVALRYGINEGIAAFTAAKDAITKALD